MRRFFWLAVVVFGCVFVVLGAPTHNVREVLIGLGIGVGGNLMMWRGRAERWQATVEAVEDDWWAEIEAWNPDDWFGRPPWWERAARIERRIFEAMEADGSWNLRVRDAKDADDLMRHFGVGLNPGDTLSGFVSVVTA